MRTIRDEHLGNSPLQAGNVGFHSRNQSQRKEPGSGEGVERSTVWWLRPLPRWGEAVILLLVLAISASFRLHLIGQAPPGPHYDEAANLLDALDVLNGRLMIFSPRSYGREMLAMYIVTPFVALLGPTRLAVRLPVALASVLTILGTYLLARELFSHGEGMVRRSLEARSEAAADAQGSRRQAQWTALLATLFISLSFWPLVLNRLGLRANYLPLTEVFCFLFLWRALRSDRLADYLLSGLFLGLGLHTYIASRFVPVVLVLFFAALLLRREGRGLILPRWRRWMLLAATALLVFGPLLVYFLVNPENFILRAEGLSILNPGLHQGDPLGLWMRSIVGNLGVFGFAGDNNWVYNLPGRPGLDPVQGALFWMGLGLCLLHARQRRYLFLLIWWAVMLLPGILAPDPIPHYLRIIGTLPVTAIIAGRAAAILLSPLPQLPQRLRTAVPLALLAGLPLYSAWAGYSTWYDYFRVWLPRDEVYYAYYGYQADLAAQISHDSDPEAVYLFPINYDRGVDEYRSHPLEVLHQGSVPFHYIHVDDATVVRDLTAMCAGKRRVHLVIWTHGEHIDADPRQVLPFFLERFGQKAGEQAFRGYRIATYELPSPNVDFSDPLDFVGISAEFDTLTLVAAALAPGARSGEAIWVALRWQVTQPVARDYKASLRLIDAQGDLFGQSDASLLSNEHHPTAGWQPTQEVTTYHLLPIVPGTLPATYQVELVLYDPDTLHSLPVASQEGLVPRRAVALGMVEVGRPDGQQSLEPETPLPAVRLAAGLDLTGYRLDRTEFRPGESMHLALYWHARANVNVSHTVVVRLLTETGDLVTEWTREPALPTSRWLAGDQWRQWCALRLAPDVGTGTYQLAVAIEGSEQPAATLGLLKIQGRARSFEPPPIGHPLALRLGDTIQLLGYDLAADRVRAGESLHLTLYWQSTASMEASYTVFTHLLDGRSRLWGQKDSVPGRGMLPTTGWAVGEVIVDEYDIPVHADAPPGDYAIEIGMYQAATGQRLTVSDLEGTPVGDHLVLEPKIRITD